MPTWKERAEALLTDVLAIAEIQKPGDVEHAVKALRCATGAWKCSHEFAPARQPMAAFGAVRAAMIRALRAGVKPTEAMEKKCETCGARPMVECIPMAGEIQPGETHAARAT
jgi:hypothetical protein